MSRGIYTDAQGVLVHVTPASTGYILRYPDRTVVI